MKFSYNILKSFLLTFFFSCSRESKKSLFVEKNKIAFDFDCTLNRQHTENLPKQRSMANIEIFEQEDINLKKLFEDIKKKDYKIYIITRGYIKEIKQVLKEVGLYKYISKIYGANSAGDISPTKNDSHNKSLWANKKLNFLHKIQKENSNSTIYYFDDEEQNVKNAKKSIKNSYFIKRDINGKGNVSYLIQLVKSLIN